MSTTLQIESFADINLQTRSLLDAATAPSDTSVVIENTQGFGSGQSIYVGQPGRENCEMAVIQSVSGANGLALISGLTLSHARFEPVVAVIGDAIRIYRASNVDGSWPADRSFSLLATRNIVPDQQSTYYTDPTGSGDYWYKITCYSTSDNAETALSQAVATRGDDFSHYASISDIRSDAGFDNAYNLKDTFIDQQRRAAEAEINLALSTVYTTPFTKPVPAAISTMTIQLAAALLKSKVYNGSNPAAEQELKNIRAVLMGMKSSAGGVTDADGNQLATSPSISSYPDASPDEGGPPRSFTIESRF